MDNLRILLVDDDQRLATTLSHGLRKAMGEDLLFEVCFSGVEALSLLSAKSFDLVISDFHLPGMSGLDLLTTIRRDHRETSLVLITAFGSDELEKEARRHAIGYVTKPFELPRLAQLIRGYLWGRELGSNRDHAPRLAATDVPPGDLVSGMVMDQGDSNA